MSAVDDDRPCLLRSTRQVPDASNLRLGRQLVALARLAAEQGIGLGVVLERLGLGVPFELAAELVGDVAQVAGVGGAVGDLDVAGRQARAT